MKLWLGVSNSLLTLPEVGRRMEGTNALEAEKLTLDLDD